MNAEIDPHRCPICGNANDCAMARFEATCWCLEIVMAPGVLERIPPEAQGTACVCRSCALGRFAS